jgi:hypothetical protein
MADGTGQPTGHLRKLCNTCSRIRKIAEHPNTPHLREAGWELRVWGWKKVKGRWTLSRDVDVS